MGSFNLTLIIFINHYFNLSFFCNQFIIFNLQFTMISKLISKSLTRTFSLSKAIEAPKRFSQTISKSRALMKLYSLRPQFIGQIFIAPNATIVGDVFLGHQISIGHGTVIRGDINRVRLYFGVSIGDNCVLHTAASLPSGLPAELSIEGKTIIQSGCTLYSCMVGKNVFVGANSVILEGAKLQNGAIILPNSVVPAGRVIPAQQVWGGNPIKYVRPAKEQENFVTKNLAKQIADFGIFYNYQFLPYNNAYLYKETDPNDEKIRSHDHVHENKMKASQMKYSQDYPTVL